jgi:MFS family permease
VIAGVFSGGLVRVHHQARVIVGAITCFGLAVAGFGVVLLWVGDTSPPQVALGALLAGAAFLAVAGGSDAVSAVFRQTILQTATPDDMRGRLQGVFIVVVAGGPRAGDFLAGSVASGVGERPALLFGGLACVVGVLTAGALSRRFRAYDARHPTP